MGKIKKILENELVGGTQDTDIYPITHVNAVYDSRNDNLSGILDRIGITNISTTYNSDHTAEVLTLSQAIAKVSTEDRVLGYAGRYLSTSGWQLLLFSGSSVANWSNTENWVNIPWDYLNGLTQGKVFAGIASPTTVPIKIGDMFYIATEGGTYTNFSNFKLEDSGFAILYKVNNTWKGTNILLSLQELGNSTKNVMSQDAVSKLFTKIGMYYGNEMEITITNKISSQWIPIALKEGNSYVFTIKDAEQEDTFTYLGRYYDDTGAIKQTQFVTIKSGNTITAKVNHDIFEFKMQTSSTSTNKATVCIFDTINASVIQNKVTNLESGISNIKQLLEEYTVTSGKSLTLDYQGIAGKEYNVYIGYDEDTTGYFAIQNTGVGTITTTKPNTLNTFTLNKAGQFIIYPSGISGNIKLLIFPTSAEYTYLVQRVNEITDVLSDIKYNSYNFTFGSTSINSKNSFNVSIKKGQKYKFTYKDADFKSDIKNVIAVMKYNDDTGTAKQVQVVPKNGEFTATHDFYYMFMQVSLVDSSDNSGSLTVNINPEYNYKIVSELLASTIKEISTIESNIKTADSNIASIKTELSTLETEIQKKLSTIPDKYISYSMLDDNVRAIIEAGGGGGGSAVPNGIDISFNEDKQLQFANKNYSNGLGRKYIRNNFVESDNVLLQDVFLENTIHYISNDFTCLSKEIKLPSNSILVFVEGSISDATLIGNNTKIVAGNSYILKNVKLKGTFIVDKWKVEWFGDVSSDASTAIKNGIEILQDLSASNYTTGIRDGGRYKENYCLSFGSGEYVCKTAIDLSKYDSSGNLEDTILNLKGTRGTVIKSLVGQDEQYQSDENIKYLFSFNPPAGTGKSITINISDIKFMTPNFARGSYGTGTVHDNTGLLFVGTNTWVNNGLIQNCDFYGFATCICVNKSAYWTRIVNNIFNNSVNTIKIAGCNSTVILENSFRGSSISLDISGVNYDTGASTESMGWSICNNDFSGATDTAIYIHGNNGPGNITGNYIEAQYDSGAYQSIDMQLGSKNSYDDVFTMIDITGNSGVSNKPILMTDSSGRQYYKHNGIKLRGSIKYCTIEGYFDVDYVAGLGNTGKINVKEGQDVTKLSSCFESPVIIKD